MNEQQVKAIIEELEKAKGFTHPNGEVSYWSGDIRRILAEQLGESCPKCGEANCLQHGYHAQPESEVIQITDEQIKNALEGMAIAKGIYSTDEELKEWQVLAGKFASMANSLANILISGKVTSNDIDQANEILDEVIPYLAFKEDE